MLCRINMLGGGLRSLTAFLVSAEWWVMWAVAGLRGLLVQYDHQLWWQFGEESSVDSRRAGKARWPGTVSWYHAQSFSSMWSCWDGPATCAPHHL